MENVMKAKGSKLWAMGLALLLALPAVAADLTRGITFTDGQRLTAAQLHSLVDSASIGVTFLTGKSLLGTVDTADFVLVYDTSTGTFKKMSLSTLIMANTDLITTQTDEPNPAPNDYLLIYDASGASLRKVSVTNLVTGNTNLIVAQAPITNLLRSAQFLVSNDGTNNRISLANLWFYNFNYTRPFTNQLQHTAPTNQDAVLVWDSFTGTNKWMTLIGGITNLPISLVPTNTARLMIAETGELKQVSMLGLQVPGNGIGFVYTNMASVMTIAAATPGGTIPLDDTIPQNNEGTQVMAVAITPTSATSLLEIVAEVPYENSTASQTQVMALFQDATANALATSWRGMDQNADANGVVYLTHRMAAGTTSATVFKINVGTSSGTMTINGSGGNRRFGGTMAARLSVREIKQ